MTKDEALKLALEALTIIRGQLKSWGLGDEAIAICKQALAAPVQEPVAWMDKYGEIYKDVPEVLSTDTPLYTAPPAQAAPVPLTDEEIDAIRFSIPTKAVTQRDFELARAIEAKLKQKNAAAQPTPVREPEYWNVIDPAGNIVASETDAIRGWARIAGSYKPTVEGLLGFHGQGWRVLPKVTPPAQPAVPEGWKLVPIKPTLQMINALADTDPEHESVWDAVLAAAPEKGSAP
jgi:hypothetical protein